MQIQVQQQDVGGLVYQCGQGCLRVGVLAYHRVVMAQRTAATSFARRWVGIK